VKPKWDCVARFDLTRLKFQAGEGTEEKGVHNPGYLRELNGNITVKKRSETLGG